MKCKKIEEIYIMEDNNFTPMMKQYLEIKEEIKDSILFFRLGDFYEMFFDDAKEASKILHITLTGRNAGKDTKVPMCGIPYHSANNYVARLIKNGKKVAICEQMETAGQGIKLVRREITKIITPGTFIADEILQDSVNNYLLSLYPSENIFGIAYTDISTGEFRVTELNNKEDFFSELYKISPVECLLPENFSKDKRYLEIKNANLGSITNADEWMFDYDFAVKELQNHFAVKSLLGFGCSEMKLALCAAGALLKYLKNTQKSALPNITNMTPYRLTNVMTLDWNSQRNLELIHNMEDYSHEGTLLSVLNSTKTPMGKRQLKKWILNPLINKIEIEKRLDAVNFFHDNKTSREKTRELMEKIYDIDRLSNKVSIGSANARDMCSLSFSLKAVTELKTIFNTDSSSVLLKELLDNLDNFSDVIEKIDTCIIDSPPVSIKDGDIIKHGYSPEVDKLKKIVSHGKDWLAELQAKEIKRTGINSLKVGYTKNFGYYI
ncbi:DNA mismatch repair protein MutS [Candidatus Omnitrophus magneticus]|uniref:DNA mismatch repair protein MutS n=1 Tax=Candidatus Omnitrophus magneticus TaxID=1609969 RepID=A0A0F0CNW7_9BACT|nr:DNA mismatch repair protein MutS [Candidatus Omnitrophus magneticus]